ncbi:TPM domain-containing protein [Paenibacillus sp. 598K]|uniref:TPM domain-containing protein n=1 Tax=Paenibacillus sp. 598K TaxID=1117987 RepID=UPI000FFE69BF|nr:TPM domain-containing protein [Paenibacillus sp. 598K]
MRRSTWAALVLMLAIGLLLLPTSSLAADKQRIFDEAGLLSDSARAELETLAASYSETHQTDFILYTTDREHSVDAKRLTQDFYDERGPGYNKSFGNAAIMTVDMYTRDVYIAGFYHAKEYLDDARIQKVLDYVAPQLTNGDYAEAFRQFLERSDYYMSFEPGFNPDNILFKTWFQVAVSLALGALVVGVMAYRSGGRVTINRQTYEDSASSGVLAHRDTYLRTTTTKTKIPKNNGGGGGGGGMTRGGHSHSGGGRSF